MKRKDYYFILGISRSESTEGIKAAFRKLAKKYHPDKSGPQETRRFQDINEAYGVLSDPESRRRYTDELRQNEERKERPPRPTRSAPIYGPPRTDEFTSLDDIISSFFGDFPGFGPPRRSHEEVDLELVLSPEEAEQGCEVSAEIVLPFRCPECRGSGELGPFVCPACNGRGVERVPSVIRVFSPPGIRNGAIMEEAVSRAGLTLLVRIHVTVARS